MLGRALACRLCALDGMQVTGLTRQERSADLPMQWIRGDLRNPDDCQHLVRQQDVVFHLAHSSVPMTSDRDMVTDTLENLLPTLELLKAIAGEGDCPHVVYASSGGAVYGSSPRRVRLRETDPCLPMSSYGVQKLVAENYLRLAASRRVITCTVLRIGNAYGRALPSDRPQGLIGVAVTRVLSGEPVRVIGDPRNVRDYIHIDDVTSALELAMQPCEPFAVYNIGTGVGTAVERVLDIIETAIGRTIKRTYETSSDILALPTWCVLDVRKAHRELGWRSEISIDTGIRRLVRETGIVLAGAADRAA